MVSRSTILFCLALLVTACSGTDPPEDAFDCSNLDRYSCEIRADCEPDFCFHCSCSPFFRGCRAATDPPLYCPLLDCAQPDCCRSTEDCPFPEDVCAPPTTAGACPTCAGEAGDCDEDADCHFWEICEPIPCSCNGAGRCVRGCTAHRSWCEPGYQCSCTEHPRCLPEPCGTFEDCEADHVCVAGECLRAPCESDDDCEAICVLGRCHARFGECLSGSIP